jgi:hypothetical protein
MSSNKPILRSRAPWARAILSGLSIAAMSGLSDHAAAIPAPDPKPDAPATSGPETSGEAGPSGASKANATSSPAGPAKSKNAAPPANTQPKAKRADSPAKSGKTASQQPEQPVTLDQFLDRLMIAESGGRPTAKNPRSSALGAYQFITSTWLDVIRRHYPNIAEGKSRTQLLALRTDPKVSRKAAAAYTRDLAAALRSNGLKDTFVNLRLAYLLGPSAGVRVLQADDTQRVAALISRPALRANPFLARLTVAGLRARARRDLSLAGDPNLNLKLPKGARHKARGPRIKVRCNLARASCKRWLALQKRKLRAQARRKSRTQ